MSGSNIVILRSCTECRHVSPRWKWRHVECCPSGHFVDRRPILPTDHTRRKMPALIPIPDWCPLGARRKVEGKFAEFAEFDGKLRQVIDGPPPKKGGDRG